MILQNYGFGLMVIQGGPRLGMVEVWKGGGWGCERDPPEDGTTLNLDCGGACGNLCVIKLYTRAHTHIHTHKTHMQNWGNLKKIRKHSGCDTVL